ncbi:unnamed protein product [Linum trigynum]|uniref:GRF-type domain-containing protein n=1 Tax=Linum trigynum TaxID=586398 RepID=A0AAV2GCR6_9ROSI
MEGPFCHCGDPASLKTSWTDANPGRRFFGCGKFGRGGTLNYFRWHGPVLDDHVKYLVLNLHRRIRELEKRQQERESNFLTKKVYIFVFVDILCSFLWNAN